MKQLIIEIVDTLYDSADSLELANMMNVFKRIMADLLST